MPARTPTALALAVTAALALSGPAMGQESVEWSYEGPTGPELWGSLSPAFAACGEGSLQSPIDLRDPSRRPAPRIDTDYTPSALGELNNGETIEVRSDLAQTLSVGDKPYSLVQFHFHLPSEHLVRGDDAPVEIHFVHQAADGERAVLGALVEEGRRNAAFASLAASFPKAAGEETRVDAAVDLTELLPAARRAYRYPGSLTTPPCTEGIRWLVLARPVRISEHQLEALEEIVDGNARPVQPRHGRPLVLF
jgi:carbonic anhydrase